MNLPSIVTGALLALIFAALIFAALMVGILTPNAQLIRLGGSSKFLIGQNVERTGSHYVASTS